MSQILVAANPPRFSWTFFFLDRQGRDQKVHNRWRYSRIRRNGWLASGPLVFWIGLQMGAKTPEWHRQLWRFLGRFRCRQLFRWRGMDLNHQPRAYEHSSCPSHHLIPETTLRAISLGRRCNKSLGLSPLPRKLSQHFTD